MDRKLSSLFLVSLLAALISLPAAGQLSLPVLFSDGMVLQREQEVKIWGRAAENEKISLCFRDSAYHTRADDRGRWEILLQASRAGGPFEMLISASDTLRIRDIMIGDVWVCSGQSNMETPISRVRVIYEKELAGPRNPAIRHFYVPRKYAFCEPLEDLDGGRWTSAAGESFNDFPAAAYFFAEDISERYGIPVGLINASLGGSPAQAWMSEKALEKYPAYLKELQRFKDSSLIERIIKADRTRAKNWYDRLGRKDAGYSDSRRPWFDPSIPEGDWQQMRIPAYLPGTASGPLNGVVWFRRRFDLPASMGGRSADLILGRIVESDSVFVNGRFVGTTSYQYPPRRYRVPPGLLAEGGNTLVVRIIIPRGTGGFSPGKEYEIRSGEYTVDLKGLWQYRVGAEMEPLKEETFIRWKPGGLYNAMIAPLLDYGIRGILWYQGEANYQRPGEYAELFPDLIRDWREQWKREDLPFLFVQLPNYDPQRNPQNCNWAWIREAQLKALSLPETGMAVAIDLGEWNDIHPLRKREVGQRLALAARKVVYREEGIAGPGPLYQSMEISGNRILLQFSGTDGGLISSDGKGLRHFTVAGADRKFYPASAILEGDKVLVWSKQVPGPVAVRYAWTDNPEGVNLFNREGLPAIPFRTDNWARQVR